MYRSMKALYKLFILIFITLCLAGCGRTPKLMPLPNDAVILAFGDSLTYGTGADTEQSYPAVLQKMIGRKVVNMGIPGELSSEGIKRLPEVLDQIKPQLLILCHGGNDLLRRTGEGTAADNLRAMVKLAKSRRIEVVMIAVPKPGLSLAPPDYYEAVAKENNVPIEVNILSVILRDNTLKSDTVHPNAAGYKVFAEAVARLLEKSNAIN